RRRRHQPPGVPIEKAPRRKGWHRAVTRLDQRRLDEETVLSREADDFEMTKRRHCDDFVVLTKSPHRWQKLPTTMKQAILAGVDRPRHIRLDIAEKALMSMPPVRIFDGAWVGPGYEGVVHGRSKRLRIGEPWQIGVELPAPTVVYADDAALR